MKKIETNKYCFVINSSAIGDVCAALPVIKYAKENLTPQCKVLAPPQFKNLFWFIPEEDFSSVFDTFKFDEPHVVVKLNILETKIKIVSKADDTGVTFSDYIVQRPTPLRMSLSNYASINLLNRVLPVENLNYLRYPIETIKEKIDKLGVKDWSKAVLLTSVFRAQNRQWNPNEYKKLCQAIKDKGFIPVHIGKSKSEFNDNMPYYTNDALDYSIGVNLIDKTNLEQLILMMDNCAAVVGIDNGIIHLAGMTKAKIVAGYTMMDADLRMPIRDNTIGKDCYPVVPTIQCRFCQSEWQLDGHDFSYCYYKHSKCCEEMTADKFMEQLNKVLI